MANFMLSKTPLRLTLFPSDLSNFFFKQVYSMRYHQANHVPISKCPIYRPISLFPISYYYKPQAWLNTHHSDPFEKFVVKNWPSHWCTPKATMYFTIGAYLQSFILSYNLLLQFIGRSNSAQKCLYSNIFHFQKRSCL